jgi:hypothetical protein
MIEYLILVFVLVLLLSSSSRGGSGCGINDLSRWEAFGGTLKRPPPPAPSRKAKDNGSV